MVPCMQHAMLMLSKRFGKRQRFCVLRAETKVLLGQLDGVNTMDSSTYYITIIIFV